MARRSPFGWALAALKRRPERARGIARRVLGDELGARVWKAACVAQVREGQKTRLDSPRTDPSLRARFVRLAVRIAERTEPTRRRAMSGKLWQGWLAITEGLSIRQVQRYLRALQRAQVFDRHQPPAAVLPDRLVGRSGWAYCAYTWSAGFSPETQRVLLAWRARALPPAFSPPS